MKDSQSSNSARVLAVIVLYQVAPRDSICLRSLEAAKTHVNAGNMCLKTILFDNTPGSQASSPVGGTELYAPFGVNCGLAFAYNQALSVACAEGFDWLLTIDQDTSLPTDFLEKIASVARDIEEDHSVAAIVPQLVSGKRILSPNYVHIWGDHAAPAGYVGLNEGELYALNSGTLLRVSAVRDLGGFSEQFWLDQLDLWLHRQLYRSGKRVFVAGSIRVPHQLSLMNYDTISSTRYRDFLEAESAFFDQFRSPVANLALIARLLVRYLKQYRTRTRPAIVKLLGQALRQRVFARRATRIAAWQEKTRQRIAQTVAKTNWQLPPDTCPRVSVCMAAYNGGQYIERQLRSILDQLTDIDEVIVVDDCSQDQTIDIISSLRDGRVRIIRNRENQGVLRSFERAVAAARGQVIFLSDQDDLWKPDKVATVLKAFEASPEVDMVASDAEIIDASGLLRRSSYYAQRGRFKSGVFTNLVKCSYLGCTMAFRSRIRTYVLPFPTDKDVLHDLWIGAANALMGGRTLYLERPLVSYRRHEDNATGNRRLTFTRRLRMRWHLFGALARLWAKLPN